MPIFAIAHYFSNFRITLWQNSFFDLHWNYILNHSWQVAWNVKARHHHGHIMRFHGKKRTDFNLSATRKPKFLVMPKASSIRTNLYTTQRDYMFFFSVSNLAFGFVLWQIWCSYYLEREWILLICIFETRTSMPYLASMYICICCLLGCQKKYQDKTRCAKINKSIHLPRPI